MTRIIDLLCKKDLTVRVPDEADRRRFKIQLTEGGKAKIEEVLPIGKKARTVAWNNLDDEQITQLEVTLNQIFDNLEF